MEPKLYELAYLLRNEPEEALKPILEKIREYIEKKNGRSLEGVSLSRRRFSYPIRKENEGFFGHLKFFIKAEDLAELEEILKREKSILRYLLTKIKRLEAEVRPQVRIIRKPVEKKAVDLAEIDKKLEEILGS